MTNNIRDGLNRPYYIKNMIENTKPNIGPYLHDES